MRNDERGGGLYAFGTLRQMNVRLLNQFNGATPH